jgi:hypothetical protein
MPCFISPKFCYYLWLKNARATGAPSIPPAKYILLVTKICVPLVLLIVFPAIYICPEVIVFTFSELWPPPIWAVMNALIAFCVGTTLSLLAVKYGSVLNCVIVAEPTPKLTEPNVNDCNPDKLNALAFNVAVPVDC